MQNPGIALLELQELELVIAESEILHARLAPEVAGEVKGRIAILRQAMDADTLRRYDRLRQQGLAVAKLHEGVCNGCRLNIPQGEIIRMKKVEGIPGCPNCGRFLAMVD